MEQDARRILRLAEEADGGPEGVTALAELMEKVVKGPGRLLAEYELYLLAARRAFLRTTGRDLANYTGLPASWVINRVTCAADVPSPVGPLMCQGVPWPRRRSSSR